MRYRPAVLGILIRGIISIACMAAALFVGYHYLALVGEGRELALLGWSVVPRQSPTMLAICSASILILLVISAVMRFRARVEGINLGRRYADCCRQRLIVAASRLPRIEGAAHSNGRRREALPAASSREAVCCALVARICGLGLVPATTVFVTGTALVFIDTALSAMVLAVLAVLGWSLYRASVQGARYRSARQGQGRKAAPQWRDMDKRVRYLAAPIAASDSGLREVFGPGAAKALHDAAEGQLVVLERAMLNSRLAMAVALYGVYMVQGRAIMDGHGTWGTLLVYVGVLSVFATNLAQVAKQLTSINRFYPSVNRYARFIGPLEEATAERTPAMEIPGSRRVYIRTQTLEGLDAEWELNPGERVALLLPDRLNRGHLGVLNQYLRTDPVEGTPGLLWFACPWPHRTPGTLRETFGFPADYRWMDLITDLGHAGVPDSSLARLPQGLDTALGGTARLGGSLTLILAALAGSRAGACVIALDGAGLERLPAAQRSAVLDQLSNHAVFVAYVPAAFKRLGQFGEHRVIAGDGEALIAWAPLEFASADGAAMARFQDRVASLLTRERPRKPQHAIAEDLEEVA